MKKNGIVLLGSVLSISIFCLDTSSPSSSLEDTLYEWTRTFAQVLHTATDKHYKISDVEECFIHSCDAFLNQLDPHSGFLGPKSYQSIADKVAGEFCGIGVIIDAAKETGNKFLTIIDTIPDGPADKAGIKSLDKIVDIDGNSLEGMTIEEASAKLKGPKESRVQVKIMRESQPDLLEFTITRDVIKDQDSLCFYIEEYNVYYLSLTTFSHTAVNQLERLMNKAQEKKPRALILDLRNNSGGLLNSAVDILGLFVPKGSVAVTIKDKNNKVINTYATQREPIVAREVPLFILINNFTASAAEILAGGLVYYSEHRSLSSTSPYRLQVFLVGTQTFGKGSVQEVIPMSNNCALKITTSLYFLPQDCSIQAVGITPDFVTERMTPPNKQSNWLVSSYGRESAFKNHIHLNNNDKKTDTHPSIPEEKKRWIDRAKERLQEDSQLRDTLTLINLYHATRRCAPEKVSTRKKAVDYLNTIFVSSNRPVTLNEIKCSQ